MCMDVTETYKEMSFNSGRPHTPRRSRNCTAANVKAQVISNIFQNFVRGKMSNSEKLKFRNLHIQLLNYYTNHCTYIKVIKFIH